MLSVIIAVISMVVIGIHIAITSVAMYFSLVTMIIVGITASAIITMMRTRTTSNMIAVITVITHAFEVKGSQLRI